MTSLARSTPPACERTNERERKDGSRQSNKEEEQWRHWLASSQVRIASSASLGLRSSVRLNYVSLTNRFWRSVTESFAVSMKKGSSAAAVCFQCLEDFHLVVCHVCNQVLTPQGFLTHYGSRGLASQ